MHLKSNLENYYQIFKLISFYILFLLLFYTVALRHELNSFHLYYYFDLKSKKKIKTNFSINKFTKFNFSLIIFYFHTNLSRIYLPYTAFTVHTFRSKKLLPCVSRQHFFANDALRQTRHVVLKTNKMLMLFSQVLLLRVMHLYLVRERITFLFSYLIKNTKYKQCIRL